MRPRRPDPGPPVSLALLLVALSLGACGSSVEPGPDPDPPTDLGANIAAVSPGQVYVVYSSMSTLANPTHEALTANIYVIRGATEPSRTQVWLFGTGYGDPAGDVLAYRGDRDAMRSAAADAQDVHRIITAGFGLGAADVALRFVAPHFHLDHINQEFLTALFALGYPTSQARAWIHTLDRISFGSCTSPCCGAQPCNEQHPLFGAPFAPVLGPPILNLLEPLGTAGDGCNAELLTFNSPSGEWRVRKEAGMALGGHTNGNVNFDNVALGIRILGGANGVCQPPTGVTRVLRPHGRLP